MIGDDAVSAAALALGAANPVAGAQEVHAAGIAPVDVASEHGASPESRTSRSTTGRTPHAWWGFLNSSAS